MLAIATSIANYIFRLYTPWRNGPVFGCLSRWHTVLNFLPAWWIGRLLLFFFFLCRSPHRGAWNFIFRTILYGFRISCTVLLLCCLFLCVSDQSCLFSRLRGPFSKMFVLSQNKTKFCSPYACFTVTTGGCNSYNRLQQAPNRSKHGCSFLVIVTNHWPVCGLNSRPKKYRMKCRKLLHCWAN